MTLMEMTAILVALIALTDIATLLYVTKYILYRNCKKSLAFVLTWLDPMMFWSKRHRVFKDMQNRLYIVEQLATPL